MTHEFLSLKELKYNSYKKEVSKQTEGHSSFASGVMCQQKHLAKSEVVFVNKNSFEKINSKIYLPTAN